MQWVDQSAKWLHSFLSKPLTVLWTCLILSFLSLILNGGFIRLYSLHHDQKNLNTQIADIKNEIQSLDSQLKMAKDPSFIQRQALDRYDLATDQDLVFVFADE